MHRGIDIGQSLAVHTIVVAVVWFGLPHLSRDIAIDQPVLTVDVVDTVPETNLDEGIDALLTQPLDTPPPEEAAPDEPPPPPPPPEPPTPETKAEPVPVPSPEAAPESPPAKPEVKPVESARVAAPPRRPKDKSPATKRQKQQSVLTSKLQDLTRRTNEQRRRQQEEDEEKKKAREKLEQLLAEKQEQERQEEKDEAEEKLDELVGQALNAPSRNDGNLGVSVIDRLRNHLAGCWRPPPGAAGADALIVDIIVRYDAKGVVKNVEIEDKARFGRDETFRAAANAARRAVFDCSPLPLDAEEDTNALVFGFNPRFITRR